MIVRDKQGPADTQDRRQAISETMGRQVIISTTSTVALVHLITALRQSIVVSIAKIRSVGHLFWNRVIGIRMVAHLHIGIVFLHGRLIRLPYLHPHLHQST